MLEYIEDLCFCSMSHLNSIVGVMEDRMLY